MHPWKYIGYVRALTMYIPDISSIYMQVYSFFNYNEQQKHGISSKKKTRLFCFRENNRAVFFYLYCDSSSTAMNEWMVRNAVRMCAHLKMHSCCLCCFFGKSSGLCAAATCIATETMILIDVNTYFSTHFSSISEERFAEHFACRLSTTTLNTLAHL